MSKTQNIEMIFYYHPWSAHLLEQGLIEAGQRNLIIEVAEESILGYLCGGDAPASQGVLPLISNPSKVDLFSLAQTYPLIPAPIILAANPALRRHVLMHALVVLESRSFGCDNIYLMCHVDDAKKYEALYGIVDKFSVLWDVADYPTQGLVECTRSLNSTESLAGERWGGFYVRNHWLRESPSAPHNPAAIDRMVSAAGL